MTLLELAERCEKASGPDRELDADIWDALGLSPKYEGRRRAKYGKWARLDGGTYHFANDSAWGSNCGAPSFTASLDAAMTLVPEGWMDGLHLVWSRGLKSERVCMAKLRFMRTEGDGATPALALTAASLRARAHQESQP